jgi:hypothetical protein
VHCKAVSFSVLLEWREFQCMLKLINVIMHWYGIKEIVTHGEKLVVVKLAVVCFYTYLCEMYCVINISALEFQKIGKMTRNACKFKGLFQNCEQFLGLNAALVICTSTLLVYQ